MNWPNRPKDFDRDSSMPSATSRHMDLPQKMAAVLRAAEGESHMADDVTPLGMLLRYWNLKVPTPEGTAPGWRSR